MSGQKYCRGELGNSVLVPAGQTRTLVFTPQNAVEAVARWLHLTATSSGVSPVSFTQAFTVTAIRILGDNQMAADTPVIGSSWSSQQGYESLCVFWNRVITTTNPLSIDVTNLDPALDIVVFGATKVDFVKS